LIDVSREQLLEDFRTASAIEDSVFSRKLYRDPYEIDRCDPFSLLVGDFTFTPAPDHMTLLAGIAAVARKCLAPFLAAAGPEMLNVEDFTWISGHRNIFRTRFQRGNPEQPVASDHVLPESPLWKNFRDSEDSRFAGLVVPRVLLRERYLSSSAAANGFVYNETQDNERCFLWGNAAFALAAGIAEGFERNGWFDSPLGGPNLTKGFPARVLKHDFSEHEVATSLEVRIMEGADKALSVHGFIPLVMGIHGESLAFWTPSCHRPKVFENPIATSEARMHNQLTYVLAGSRFMHGLKVLVRDAGEHSRARLGQLLQQWIMQYVCVNDQAPESERAQRPLRAAVVSLHETPGNPESVKMVAFLLPKFGRLNELKIELRLIAEIALPVSSIDPQ
jgi:type VI secretion system protein ImpC